MFKNNLKFIVRKLRKEKLYSFVNIAGLTVGLTAFLLIALYVRDELSFDNFHENKGNIYRVINNHKDWGYSPRVPTDYVEIASDFIPQIENQTRLSIVGRPTLLSRHEGDIYAEDVFYVDQNFFEFFNFPLLDGKPNSVFSTELQAVISQEFKESFFGDTNPLGKEIKIDKDFVVTISGVATNPPKNSTIQFDMLLYKQGQFKNTFEETHGFNTVMTYVSLSPETDPVSVEDELNKLKDKPVYASALEYDNYELLPLLSQRLHAPYEGDAFDKNDISFVILFSGIGSIVLLLAIINYINLVTAQANKKTKEIGLRKVIGASKYQLIFYQLVESTTITLVAFIMAFAISERLLNTFNEVLDKDISLNYFSSDFFLWVLVFGLLLGFLSGIYPALFIARFQPLALLQKSSVSLGRKGYLRKFLVLFQFVTSGVLLVVLFIISGQMKFMKEKDLGYNTDFLVSVPLYRDSTQLYQTIKNELKTISGVQSVSLNSFRVGQSSNTSINDNPDTKAENRQSASVKAVYADKDFFKTSDVNFLWKSDDFDSEDFSEDEIMINRSLAEKFGLMTDPDGRRLYGYNDKVGKKLVAIVEDFHTYSLKEEIKPLIIQYLNDWGTRNVLLKLEGDKAKAVLEQVGEKYQAVFQRPFEYYFLDDQVKAFYKKEQGQFMLFQIFSGLAVFISLLGLIALTIYTLEQRRKEVSIRKVLGASIQNLLLLLNKEYTLLVVLAFLIASPIAYYAMQGWLAEFKYRIDITPLIFIGAFLSFLALSWMVTLLQSLQVSKANPADTLREE
ncbi:FtsX-like permease family protein [uncultured Roseivirga sp.]|mgnify:FL=1|uniref:ABC transporter permease n=1 Tax=uncultured Roseivirga sp. TaxID=543088 RepID=UPI0030D7DDE6